MVLNRYKLGDRGQNGGQAEIYSWYSTLTSERFCMEKVDMRTGNPVYRIRSLDSQDDCLRALGLTVDFTKCSYTNPYRWELVRKDDWAMYWEGYSVYTTYVFKSLDNDKCLDVYNGNSRDGASLITFQCLDDHPNQRWY